MAAPRQPSRARPDTPHVEQLLHGDSDRLKEDIIQQADQLVSTVNPAVLPDGSNITDAPPPKIDPHICNKVYGDIQDLNEDLADHTSATRCMGISRTSMRTWLTWWPPASDTPAAPLPTASALSMASRSVASDTPNPCSPTQPSSQRKSQLSSQLGMTG